MDSGKVLQLNLEKKTIFPDLIIVIIPICLYLGFFFTSLFINYQENFKTIFFINSILFISTNVSLGLFTRFSFCEKLNKLEKYQLIMFTIAMNCLFLFSLVLFQIQETKKLLFSKTFVTFLLNCLVFHLISMV